MTSTDSFRETRRESIKLRLAELVEDYKAANAQLGRVYDDVERIRIERTVRDLDYRIRATEQELASLPSTAASSKRPAVESVNADATVVVKKFSWKALWERPDLLIGQTISSYYLLDVLGAGGSGIVYRALHRTLARAAAVKVFYPVDPSSSDVYSFFERGVRALAALDHPNIVRAFDSGPLRVGEMKSFYLAMEYVNGAPLDQWSASLGGEQDALAQRLDAALSLTRALQAAHEAVYFDQSGLEVRGVLHGDLKPANVLVSKRAGVKLTDFLFIDIQRLLDPRVKQPRILSKILLDRREATKKFGTPGFMAPEQEYDGIISPASDIFGLGVTLGDLFYPSSNHNWMIDLLSDGTMKNPQALQDLILKMCSKEPKRRPSSARAVADQLRAIRLQELGRNRSGHRQPPSTGSSR